MELTSPAEQGKLEHTAQAEMLKKNMAMQAASAKKLEALYIPGSSIKNMTRLQVRSYPLGCDIILDGKHTEKLTPWTFENLTEGAHTVEIHYVKETGEIVSKMEGIELHKNKRAVVKLHFKEPKTLAEPIV